MARAQQWTRNISKRIKKVKTIDRRNIVNDDLLEGIKRKAKDWGVIMHARPKTAGEKKGGAK
jgi:hypothetical protein